MQILFSCNDNCTLCFENPQDAFRRYTSQIKNTMEAVKANRTLIHKALPARFQLPAPIFCAATVLMADAIAVDGSMAKPSNLLQIPAAALAATPKPLIIAAMQRKEIADMTSCKEIGSPIFNNSNALSLCR